MNNKSKPITITVITATKNAATPLPVLIASLNSQCDKEFVWVVCDGDSSDATLRLISHSGIKKKLILRRADFGIYDALNSGVLSVETDYYLVLGADDQLESDAIKNYKEICNRFNDPDFVAASVVVNGRLIKPRKGLGWLYGMIGEASSHSVGLLIRTDLHKKFGMYSCRFPIAADQLFVLSCLSDTKVSIVRSNFMAGVFGTSGTSGSDAFGMITELFRVQVRLGRNLLLQILILIFRVWKAYCSYLYQASINFLRS